MSIFRCRPSAVNARFPHPLGGAAKPSPLPTSRAEPLPQPVQIPSLYTAVTGAEIVEQSSDLDDLIRNMVAIVDAFLDEDVAIWQHGRLIVVVTAQAKVIRVAGPRRS